MKYDTEQVEWRLPEIIELENFTTPDLVVPEYLTKLGDYKKVIEFFGGGENVMIGVCDTGIANAHIARGGELEGAIARDFTSSPSGSNDVHGHGSHVAHNISSKLIGIAPKSSVRIAKVLGDSGSGSSTNIARGIDWLVSEMVASGKQGIINMSLGGGYSRAIDNAIKRAVQQKVIVFASIGNSGGTETGPDRGGYPGRLSETLGIGAVDYNKRPASFSSRSEDTDISGYGVGILSCGILKNQYRKLSGTSMASPHEAGIAALIIGHLRGKGIRLDSKEKYLNYVKPFIEDLSIPGEDKATGLGKIDILKLKAKLEESDPVDPDPDPEDPECKVVEKYLVPKKRVKTVKVTTYFNVDGSVKSENEQVVSNFTEFQFWKQNIINEN